MKKIIRILGVVILGIYASLGMAIAEVRFEIVYADEPDEGFHIRPEARKSLEEAVALVFSWLDHDAVVKIKVESFIDVNRNVFAEAGSTYHRENFVPGIYHTHLARKILLGEEESLYDYDATIKVNFYHEDKYGYEAKLESNQVDFKSIIMHELTHALGFVSWINNNDEEIDKSNEGSNCLEAVYLYYQKFEDEARSNECWERVDEFFDFGISADLILLSYNKKGESFTYFDTLLVDDQGNKVIDTKNFRFIRKDLYKLEEGDSNKVLYFPVESKSAIKLYPLNGMDLSHVAKFSSDYMLMEANIRRGLSFGYWSSLECEIMKALGYKLKPVKKGAWVWRWIGELKRDGVIWRVTMGVDGVKSKVVVEAEKSVDDEV